VDRPSLDALFARDLVPYRPHGSARRDPCLKTIRLQAVLLAVVPWKVAEKRARERGDPTLLRAGHRDEMAQEKLERMDPDDSPCGYGPTGSTD